MAFPFKVPNPAKVGPRTHPDLAELTAIRRLRDLAIRIGDLYSPGLRIDLIHDGGLIRNAFGVTMPEVRAYETYFSRMIDVSGAGDFVRCHDFEDLQARAGMNPQGAVDRLRDEAETWFRQHRATGPWREQFRKTLGMLNLRELPRQEAGQVLAAGRHGALPVEYGAIEQRVHVAMVTYRVLDALIHLLDPRPFCFPDAIHATTRVRPRRLALWLVRRGNALLPWHGVGTIDGQGRSGVALAEQVAADRSLTPLTLPGESTPFCYMPGGAGVTRSHLPAS